MIRAGAYNANKFRARKTVVDGITFDSIAESRRYCELKLLFKARKITCLEVQVKYPILVNDELICTYIADAVYYDLDKECLVVEDTKGFRTRDYIIKKKLMKAVHGITITEVKA